MKFIIDSLVVLMVVGILGGVFYFARTERQMEQQVELARNELRRFESELLLLLLFAQFSESEAVAFRDHLTLAIRRLELVLAEAVAQDQL